MTLEDLVVRLNELGFVCHAETYGGITKLVVAKRAATPGNRLSGHRGPWMEEDATGAIPEVDGPSPHINIEEGAIDFHFGIRVPGPPDQYWRELNTIDELYEELLHYWFDADSPMSREDGFISGPGRPSGA